MKPWNILIFIWVMSMTAISVIGILPSSPAHTICKIIDPPSDLEIWKNSR